MTGPNLVPIEHVQTIRAADLAAWAIGLTFLLLTVGVSPLSTAWPWVVGATVIQFVARQLIGPRQHWRTDTNTNGSNEVRPRFLSHLVLVAIGVLVITLVPNLAAIGFWCAPLVLVLMAHAFDARVARRNGVPRSPPRSSQRSP